MAKTVKMKIDFSKSMEQEKILSGLVVSCKSYHTSDIEVEYMLEVNCLGNLVNIPGSEIITHQTKSTPNFLVGENINFVVIEVNENIIMGSMKKANEILSKPIMDKLLGGEVLKGMVSYITPYGAYINIDGVVSGFMKNYDFSDDGTEIREIYPKYSTIEVKFKKYSSNGNIIFLPAKKRKGKAMYDISQIEHGQTYLGKVTDVPSTMNYVRVIIDGKNLKVKCNYPRKVQDVKVGDIVVVSITKKEQIEGKDKYVIFGNIINRIESFQNNQGRRF